MSDIHFSRGIAVIGILGGVAIAIVVPCMVVVYGTHITGMVAAALIVLGVLLGSCVSVISIVVGVAIPSVIKNGGIDLTRFTGGKSTGADRKSGEKRHDKRDS